MQIVNYGSLNIDFVYTVEHIARPGETIQSSDLAIHCGGKGLNQSVALARAGARPVHAGMVGPDGAILLELCTADGVDISHIRQLPVRTGNAVIQVESSGQNSIVLFGGANLHNKKHYVDETLGNCAPGDMILLQNEINLNEYIIDRAAEKGMNIVLNPAPCNAALHACDLSKVSLFIMNEVEGRQICGTTDPEAVLDAMQRLYPAASVVLTLGDKGVLYRGKDGSFSQPVWPTQVVDTTGAGDTFTGYFLAARLEGQSTPAALNLAAAASAIAVSRFGAAGSIPLRHEVEKKMAGRPD